MYTTFRRPAVIRRLHSGSAPRELCPLLPVVTPVITARSDAPQQSHGTQIQPKAYEKFGLWGGKFFNLPEFLRHFEENE